MCARALYAVQSLNDMPRRNRKSSLMPTRSEWHTSLLLLPVRHFMDMDDSGIHTETAAFAPTRLSQSHQDRLI